MIIDWARTRAFDGVHSGLLAHLDLCLGGDATELSVPVLGGLFGHPFESSYARRGAELWFGGELEWTHHPRGFERLGRSVQCVQRGARPHGDGPRPSSADWNDALERGRELALASLERGRPVLGWSLMSPEQRDAGLGAFTWGHDDSPWRKLSDRQISDLATHPLPADAGNHQR